MRYTLLIILISIALSSNAQPNNWEIKFNADFFSKKELVDSGYRAVRVLKYNYDYDQPAQTVDTVYIARLDRTANPIFEKTTRTEFDSITSFYTYTKQGVLSQQVNNRYISNGRFKSRNKVISQYANGLLVKEESWDEDQLSLTYFYDYNNKNKLIKSTIFINDTAKIVSLYTYNNKDSLVAIKETETYGNISDSILHYYKYDSYGRLIEESKKPSKTYIKRFNYDCAEGLYFYIRQAYDSLGRKVFETAMGEEEMKRISYAGRAYKRIEHYENGFVEKWYDTRNKLQESSVYSFYNSRSFLGRVLSETYNDTFKQTAFLSQNSSLPKTIELNKGGYKTTYILEYFK